MAKWRMLTVWALLLAMLWGTGAQPVVPADGTAEVPETKYVALTFDDGPRPSTTGRLLDGLRERGASATFFLIGSSAAAHPELVQRMAAEGHQVGNHTWSHADLRKGGLEAALEEVRRTERFLGQLLGEGDHWLRPPYGFLTEELKSHLSVPVVTWSVDPRDWESRDTEKVIQLVLRDTRPGSIILLHDIYDTSVEAALQIVDALHAEGYRFVTVEELLLLTGVEPKAGTRYRSADL